MTFYDLTKPLDTTQLVVMEVMAMLGRSKMMMSTLSVSLSKTV